MTNYSCLLEVNFSLSSWSSTFFLLNPWGHCSFHWVCGVRSIHAFQAVWSLPPALLFIPWTFGDFSWKFFALSLPAKVPPTTVLADFIPALQGMYRTWSQPGAAWVLLFQSRRKSLNISRGRESWGCVMVKASDLEAFLVAAEQFCHWHYHILICSSPQTEWNMALLCKKAR